MRVTWSPKASDDLVRLERFLQPKSPLVAKRVVRLLIAGPNRLVDHPRLGEIVEGATGVELRRLLIDAYEIQYEVRPGEILVARVFHMREDR